MRRSRFTETQIVSILKEADAGASVKDICRRHGISPATWYQWKSKYGGMGASELKRTKELEAELGQMKRMYGMHPVGTTVVPTPDGAHSSNIRTPQRRCPSDAYQTRLISPGGRRFLEACRGRFATRESRKNACRIDSTLQRRPPVPVMSRWAATETARSP